MIELPDLPQPSQHPELRDWAERLTVTLKLLNEILAENVGNTGNDDEGFLAAIQLGLE